MNVNKNFKWSNVLFLLIVALLIIPQTRTPIQVAFQKVKMQLPFFSASAFAKASQEQLTPFNYNLKNSNNETESVAIGNGEVAFINYWATWCPPCIAEMPSIQALYNTYGDRINFLIITQEDPEVVDKFLAKKELKIPVFYPNMQRPELLVERSIPTTFIIDKSGKIIVKELGAIDWNSSEVHIILDAALAETD